MKQKKFCFRKTEQKEENWERNGCGIKDRFEKQVFSRLSCLRNIHALSKLIIANKEGGK
jgi:hypothetical protein